MPTTARVVILAKDPGPLRIEEIQLPDPGPYQVVVKQFASGVCHSQLHQMHAPNRPGDSILGHESTGVVLARGKNVTHVKEGDHVMVTWVPRDRRADRHPESAVLTVPGGQAISQNVFTWADHTIADELYVVPMAKNEKTDVTSIIGCAVMTGSGAVYHSAGVKKGQSVAIFGVGGVGLSAVAAARVVEADPIIAVDLREDKLEFAQKFGATHLVNASQGDPVEKIREITRDPFLTSIMGSPVAGVDFAFDCIGVAATMNQIIPAARTSQPATTIGGTAVLVGVPQGEIKIDPMDMLLHEKHFMGSLGGSCSPDDDFPMFLRWYREGDLDLDAMVTERYTIDQINEATSALQAGKIFGRSILEF